MKLSEKLSRIKIAFGLIFFLNLTFWMASQYIYAKWEGVPPVPSLRGAVTMTLGDPEFSYRVLAMTLQNLGDSGREITPFKNYNYERLGQWFFLLHKLDPASDHVPMVAAYYFGGTRIPKDAAEVVKYLAVAGNIPVGEKWRWLAHAAFLAEHRMNNFDLALDLAYKLSKMPNSAEMPQWARQMPAFVLRERGDKAASRKLMENMLVTEKNPDPNEVNMMKAFLIEQLGVDPKEVETLVRMRGKSPPAK